MPIESSSVSFGSPGGGSNSGGGAVLPFRILAVADLGREGLGIGDEAEARTHSVDKDTFDDLFGKLTPKLIFDVVNRLAPGGDDISVNLEFKSIRDFDGAAVAKHVPGLKELVELRAQIVERAKNEPTPDGLAKIVQELAGGTDIGAELTRLARSGGGAAASAPAPPSESSSAPDTAASDASGDGSVDSILSMVGEGEGETSSPPPGDKASKALGSVISSITKSAKERAPSKRTQGALGAIHDWFDGAIGHQLDDVLHHPEFQSMESAWRGLRFLIERTDFRKEIVVEVLAARKKDLRKVLIGEVLDAEYNQPGDPPLAMVFCDVEFDNTQPDIELLNELAVKCESIQAPVVGHAGAKFFGLESLHDLGLSGSLSEKLGGSQYAKWRGLREKDEMRWAGLTMNRMLLRRPAEGGNEGKSYPEKCGEGRGEGLLWGSAVWALASCATASFAREGWAYSLSGPRGGGAVDDLPLRAFEGRAGKVSQTPLEASISEAHVRDLAAAGLIPLQSSENSDRAYFSFLPTVRAAKRYSNPAATMEAALHAIIPYQLFASRMGQWIGVIVRGAAGAGSAEELQTRLESDLAGILGAPGSKGDLPHIRVEVTDDEEDPTRYEVCFELKPAVKFFGQTPRLLLAIGIAK